MPKAPTREQATKVEFHQEALRLYNEVVDVEKDQRALCVEDQEFCDVAGSQWDESAYDQREGRPRLEINKVALPRNVFMGDFRQNDMSVKYRPSSGGATRKTAEVYNGIARHIQERSGWQSIATGCVKEQVTGGFGAFGIKTQFASDDTFGQEIRFRMIRSAATSVYPDPSSILENGEDMNYCFVTELLARKVFKARYPDAAATDVSHPSDVNARFSRDWFEPERVRIAEYWVREKVEQTLLLMSDGRTLVREDSEDILDELAAGVDGEEPVIQVKERKVTRHKVTFYLISGSEVLEGPMEWLGQNIPIILVYGYNNWINGKHYYKGMIRTGKDPQRAYNYLSSQRAEVAGLAPKDIFWLTETQVEGHEGTLARMNVDNRPFQLFNPDPDNPGPPQRSGAAAPQVEMAAQLIQADQDLQATTGKFSPTLGEGASGQSGVAINQLNRASDQATFEFLDNFSMAMKVGGNMLAELIPLVMSEPQVVRVIGDDATEEFVPINQTVKDEETGEPVMVNDLSVGKYDVKVDIGPTFATKRTEGFDALSRIIAEAPALAPLSLDLLAKNMDFPFAEELEKRLRKPMLAQGIVEPNEEEEEEIAKAQQNQQGQEQGPSHEEMLQGGQLDTIERNNELTAAKIETEKANTAKVQSETLKNLTASVENRTDAVATAAEAGVPVPAGELEAAAEAQTLGDLLNQPDEQTGQAPGSPPQ